MMFLPIKLISASIIGTASLASSRFHRVFGAFVRRGKLLMNNFLNSFFPSLSRRALNESESAREEDIVNTSLQQGGRSFQGNCLMKQIIGVARAAVSTSKPAARKPINRRRRVSMD
jgi:DNA-binding transcriptional regulator of glucitol operon